ncbi:MAG: hypothetical protein J5637_04080 [Prevotella sp.]|nr:hypothetical protein [Prevotella sp.]
MHRIKRAIIWLKRIGHGRGFSVQSPNDYRFLRNVIKQSSPYYKYDELQRSADHHGAPSKKICQLYFRLANYAQADYFLEINSLTDDVPEYVEAASKKTKTIRLQLPENRMPEECKGMTLLARCSYAPGMDDLVKQVVSDSDERSVIVVDNIYADSDAQRFWEQLSDDSQVTVSYDLYHCGILLKESRRYKKKYFVNY